VNLKSRYGARARPRIQWLDRASQSQTVQVAGPPQVPMLVSPISRPGKY
jgi:hypothetical protein